MTIESQIEAAENVCDVEVRALEWFCFLFSSFTFFVPFDLFSSFFSFLFLTISLVHHACKQTTFRYALLHSHLYSRLSTTLLPSLSPSLSPSLPFPFPSLPLPSLSPPPSPLPSPPNTSIDNLKKVFTESMSKAVEGVPLQYLSNTLLYTLQFPGNYIQV